MTYVSDTMRIELSLPIHIMLSVLLSGANCADPGPVPGPDARKWMDAWARHEHRLQNDPEFAAAYKIFVETRTLLMEACVEAFAGVQPAKKEISLLRRVERVHLKVVQPYIQDGNPDPRKIGIIAFYLLQHLVDTNTLIVPEDSAFGLALAHMLPALSPQDEAGHQEVEDYDALNRSAQKQVRKILQHLQSEGYYLGISLPDY